MKLATQCCHSVKAPGTSELATPVMNSTDTDDTIPRHPTAVKFRVENHVAMLAIHYMHYNFARIHKTLRVTPAMEAGVSTHVWTIEEIVASDRMRGA